MPVDVAASAASLSTRPAGGDDFTLTPRQSWTLTRQRQQVRGPVGSEVAGFYGERRPGATAAAGSRHRRTQSSTAVFRHGQAADSAWQIDSALSRQSLGSTYDEGDYDPVDTVRPAVATTPLSTLQRQTVASSSSSYTLPLHQQQHQQQTTSSVRGHRRTQSTGLTDVDRGPPAQVGYNDGLFTRVRVQPDRGRHVTGNSDQETGYRSETIRRQATARRPADSGNVMVVTNVGYEPTTLQHQAAHGRTSPVIVESSPTSARLNGDSARYQSSASYDQTSTHVQSPSYATVHQVQQTTSPGSSTLQRAVIVDSSELISREQQQQQLLLERQQHEMLLKQQEEEIEKLQLQLLTRQHEQRQLAQNLASVPSRGTPERLPVIQIGDADGRNRFESSTLTTSTFATGSAGTGVMGNGPSRWASRPVHAAGRHQSPGNFSTSLNSSNGGNSRSTTMSTDDYTVRRVDVVDSGGGGGAGGEVVVPVMRRRAGGADTPSSVSSAASWRRSGGGTQQRFSTASSSGATEQSSVELGNESSLGRVSPFVGEGRVNFRSVLFDAVP